MPYEGFGNSYISLFFNDTATTEIYTLSLHDALPIYTLSHETSSCCVAPKRSSTMAAMSRSEEHTSELQSPCNLVCRPLLEKKRNIPTVNTELNRVRSALGNFLPHDK